MAGALNLVGALSGEAVAKTVGSGIVDKTVVTQDTVVAALIGAIIWDLITFVTASPTPSSHALIFSVIGAAVSLHGLGVMTARGPRRKRRRRLAGQSADGHAPHGAGGRERFRGGDRGSDGDRYRVPVLPAYLDRARALRRHPRRRVDTGPFRRSLGHSRLQR